MTTLDAPEGLASPVGAARIAELTRLVRSTTGTSRTARSPITGEGFAEIPQSDPDDVEEAFRIARRTQTSWAQTSLRERKRALLRLHDLLLERQDELMDIVQLETGKSRFDAFGEVLHLALTARYYGRRLHRQLRPSHPSGVFPGLTSIELRRVPKGVVGIISPWNYPLTVALCDGLPALAAGNTVVHKPDAQTPLSALAAVELLREAGFPADAWQVVLGDGPVVGGAIVQRADYICFTGSTATGRLVAQGAAERLVGCSLELGGKNAMIVLPGADLGKAAAGALAACFSTAGQLCVSVERLYVPAEAYDAFSDELLARVRTMSLGVGFDWDPDMGSLVSQQQLDAVSRHVDDAVAHGATVLAGGVPRPDLGPWFYEPTVLEDVPPTAQLYAGETFGPVVSLYPYRDVDEAVELANAGEYGLNASVWGPVREAKAVAARIKAGTVNINEGYAGTFASVDAPMGGMRQSGLGRRQGDEGIWRYTESQSVAVQRLLPITGPASMARERYAGLVTTSLKILRRTPRA
ncbi:succinic semialdehyde dehydrogenase [Aeromicrobium wangtongii]|uniref:Succinic semialdehyde dehydrogenase n=1 Tax=Aeromicrobium wangtongii TaxID=2969247 RepID=A0ABY5M4J7_9ACTN|nr:succinic semialdehyde dehydrogenase [Aeromicrobium wangtongii]MCD9198860.1 succinate-semialdehyde dehydrogenase (NADP(+)) [Aeromicrobium wangtongii]UUP13100.1 succinic semialdehyde dehydrogenase [Aeromicrobium wangtongii]